jgi:hypothetical protein
MKTLALLAAAVAAAALYPATGQAATVLPHVITIKPGETPRAAWARAVLQEVLARHGINTLPTHAVNPAAAPSIGSGKILSTSLDVTAQPASAKVSFKYAAPGFFNYAFFEFTSPGGQVLFAFYGAPVPSATSGSITFLDPEDTLSLYAQPGKWTLTQASIVDGADVETDYTGSALAALFPSLTLKVVNAGEADFTPPVVTAGKVVTKKVSLSSPFPYFEAKLTITDDMSGVAYPIVFIGPSTDLGLSINDVPPLPKLSGVFPSATPVTDFVPANPGTWFIIGYGAVDVAGNFFEDTTAADVQTLFGTTTFKVTK